MISVSEDLSYKQETFYHYLTCLFIKCKILKYIEDDGSVSVKQGRLLILIFPVKFILLICLLNYLYDPV